MKTKSAINGLTKAGFKIENLSKGNAQKNFRYSASKNDEYVVEFTDQEGRVVCLSVTNVRSLEADGNPMNGNCYTCFPSSLKSAISMAGDCQHDFIEESRMKDGILENFSFCVKCGEEVEES